MWSEWNVPSVVLVFVCLPYLGWSPANFICTKREKGRDLTQSYDKSPYTNRNVKKAQWQHKQRHKKVRLHSGCGPTKDWLFSKQLDRLRIDYSVSNCFMNIKMKSNIINVETSFRLRIDYSVSNCFMNIKMKSNIINVETSFRHANHSAAFVSVRLLRFHIPKFHPIPVTCWCLLPSDLVNTSE